MSSPRAEIDASDWLEYRDEYGRRYCCCEQTNESSWDPPHGWTGNSFNSAPARDEDDASLALAMSIAASAPALGLTLLAVLERIYPTMAATRTNAPRSRLSAPSVVRPRRSSARSTSPATLRFTCAADAARPSSSSSALRAVPTRPPPAQRAAHHCTRSRQSCAGPAALTRCARPRRPRSRARCFEQAPTSTRASTAPGETEAKVRALEFELEALRGELDATVIRLARAVARERASTRLADEVRSREHAESLTQGLSTTLWPKQRRRRSSRALARPLRISRRSRCCASASRESSAPANRSTRCRRRRTTTGRVLVCRGCVFWRRPTTAAACRKQRPGARGLGTRGGHGARGGRASRCAVAKRHRPVQPPAKSKRNLASGTSARCKGSRPVEADARTAEEGNERGSPSRRDSARV